MGRRREPKDWERIEGIDTAKSWPVFEAYRDMPHPRHLGTIAKKMGVAENTVYGWSSDQDWAGRIASYDSHLARVKVRAAESETARMARRHAKNARLLQRVGKLEFTKLLSEVKRMAAGGTIKSRDALRAIIDGAKLERLVAGEVTERTGEEFDYSKLSDDELETMQKLVAKMKGVSG